MRQGERGEGDSQGEIGEEGVVAGPRWGVGLRVFEERVCMWDGVHVHHASRLTPKGGVSWGVGYVMGKSMTFCLIFEEVKHAGLPPRSLPPLHVRRFHKETTQINRDPFWSALCFLQPSAYESPCQRPRWVTASPPTPTAYVFESWASS